MQIQGEKIEINVDSSGFFTARVGLDYLKFETLKELEAAARKALRKTRVTVAVPATLIHVSKYSGVGYTRKYHGETCRRVILTGINPKTDEVNYVFEDTGEKGAHERFGSRSGKFGRPMTDDDIREWERLHREKKAAEERFEKFERKFVGEYSSRNFFEAEKLVRAAIQAKADEANEEEELEASDALEGDPRVSASDNRSRKRRKS